MQEKPELAPAEPIPPPKKRAGRPSTAVTSPQSVGEQAAAVLITGSKAKAARLLKLVFHLHNQLETASAAEAAVISGICGQRAGEIIAKLPPDPGIDVAAEQAKAERNIELLEGLLARTDSASCSNSDVAKLEAERA